VAYRSAKDVARQGILTVESPDFVPAAHAEAHKNGSGGRKRFCQAQQFCRPAPEPIFEAHQGFAATIENQEYSDGSARHLLLTAH
jgi:hypothetical protein